MTCHNMKIRCEYSVSFLYLPFQGGTLLYYMVVAMMGTWTKRLLFRLGAAFLICQAASLQGCTTSQVGLGEPIPENAIEIRLYTDEPPDPFFATIKRRLEMTGFGTDRHSYVDRSIDTAYMHVGRHVDLSIHLVSVVFDVNVSSTVAVFYGQTRYGLSRWKKSGGDESFAFEQMVTLVKTIPYERLEYRSR